MIEYLAGFFDGEGGAHVTTRTYNSKKGVNTYITRTMTVSNNDEQVCHLFAMRLGVGGVYEVRPGHYQWRANNSEAVAAAGILLPHLRVKAKQVQSMLDGVNMSMLRAKS